MLTLRGEALALTMDVGGENVTLTDLTRQVVWRLDQRTRLASREVAWKDDAKYTPTERSRPDSPVHVLQRGRATRLDARTIEAEHPSAGGTVKLRWRMERDRLCVSALTNLPQPATSLMLPGAFVPADEPTCRTAVPNGQGMLYSGRGPAYCRPLQSYSHAWGRSLDMVAPLASRGGLVCVAESALDATLWHEKDDTGPPRATWLEHASLGEGRYERQVVILPCDPDVTAACKTYRRYEIEQGRFKSWDEKLGDRPHLDRLFGAAMIFLGYFHDDELDYADSFRRLHAMGIDRAFVYPLLMNTTLDLTEAMGVRGTDVRQLCPLIEELGWLGGSFIYVVDGPLHDPDNPGREHLIGTDGKPKLSWQVRDLKWYKYSAAKRLDVARRMIEQDHRALRGLHYDVLTTHTMEEWNPAAPMDARACAENTRQMLELATDAGLVVSSEGFWGRMTPHYDLCNTKFIEAVGGDSFCVVPMSMLVYHDSAYQTWWEVDNYNNPEHRSQGNRGYRRPHPEYGGRAPLQAAWDALMGTPPDIFPFGLQYNFVPHSHPEFYTYRYRLEDAAVQQAIAAAKPVMQLNRRIGKLEMIEHRLHHESGALQETVFADGTRVLANFANVALPLPGQAGGGELPAESWRAI